ncbi:CIC1-like protein [Lachancea thermotolerans]
MAKSTPVKKRGGSKSTTPVSTPPVKTKKESRSGTPASTAGSTPVSTPSKKKKRAKKPATPVKVQEAAKPKEPETVVPKDRINKAVQELSKFTSKKQEDSTQLLDDDDELDKQVELIAVNTGSFTGNRKVFKPKQFKIEHSIFKPWKKASETSVKDFKTLLILRDQDADKVSEDEIYDQLRDSGITIDTVIPGADLKTKYKSFERRRAFIQDFSLILADDSVVTTLPKLLGGKAYEKVSTTPVPIRTNKKGVFSLTILSNSIKKVFEHSLPAKMPRGTTLSVHLGNLNWFTADELTQNILMVVEQLVKEFQVRSVFLKSNKSPVLPLYYNQAVLDDLAKQTKEDSKDTATRKVTIDGTELELSAFEAALMEIANPDELDKVFAGRINKAKKRAAESEEESAPDSKKAKA